MAEPDAVAAVPAASDPQISSTTTPSNSDGVLTEAAGRDQARADTATAAFTSAQPWVPEVSAPPATDMSYLAYQVLQLAVLQNETAAIVVARAATYLDWINKNV